MADIIYFQDEMHKRNQPDNKHIYVDMDGVTWYEYQYNYTHDGKAYGYSLWAKSWEDAVLTLQSMADGKIVGQVYSEE